MSEPNDKIDFSLVLASSVHDMKNSIGMLLASLEAVIEDTPPTNDVQSKRFSTLHYEASRINSELVQLLTIYRMQNKFLPIRVDQYYVIDVLEDQVARNHMLLETADISMTMRCDENLHWYYDLDLVGSVIHNVVVNCARYTKSAILVTAEVEGEFLVISVSDDGGGYPKSMLESQHYFPQEMEEEDPQSGTHLGLYFAEQIAQCHKAHEAVGRIELTNGGELGGGVFKLYLP